MNYCCPYCEVSLKWRVLGARYPSLRETRYVCPACGGELSLQHFPAAYSLQYAWLFLPLVPALRLLLSEKPVPAQWWLVVASLAVVAVAGFWWSLKFVPKNLRRYAKAGVASEGV
jgi:hypothetical protein